MGIIHRLIPLATVLLLGAATAANAVPLPDDFDDFVAFSELKQNSDGLIQDAIGVLPSSEMNGTLNRISALFGRSAVRDIEMDPGQDSDVPANFERGMEAALLDLQDDLAAAVAAFEDGDADCGGEGQLDCAEAQFIILQAIKHVVADRTIQIWNSSVFIACGCEDCPPGTVFPCTNDTIANINDLVDGIPQSWIDDISDLLTARNHDSGSPPLLDRNAWDLQQAINGFIQRAVGIPSIDYRATGVPSIDP